MNNKNIETLEQILFTTKMAAQLMSIFCDSMDEENQCDQSCPFSDACPALDEGMLQFANASNMLAKLIVQLRENKQSYLSRYLVNAVIESTEDEGGHNDQ